ncbi:MAG: hypothetical protein QY331_07130 [Melioribacteraceae bacterium]|nr:MAG: hypothetical protein QY331_07130 [Melioribacteraceae bacterium]
MKIKITILLLVVFIFSCDLFTTRDEEEPKNIGSTYVPPTTPQLLFENLKNSLSEKVIENYLASFVDSAFINSKFKYIAASGAAATFQTLADWDLSAERIYINNVFSSVQNGKIILSLINENSTPQGDSSIYFFDYSLNVPLSNPELPSVYGGSVEFVIKLDSRNQWVITTWRDIQKENLPSWSELRGRFY